jgi:hypothetical protein
MRDLGRLPGRQCECPAPGEPRPLVRLGLTLHPPPLLLLLRTCKRLLIRSGRIESTMGIPCHAPPTGTPVALRPRADAPLGVRPGPLAAARAVAQAAGGVEAARLALLALSCGGFGALGAAKGSGAQLAVARAAAEAAAAVLLARGGGRGVEGRPRGRTVGLAAGASEAGGGVSEGELEEGEISEGEGQAVEAAGVAAERGERGAQREGPGEGRGRGACGWEEGEGEEGDELAAALRAAAPEPLRSMALAGLLAARTAPRVAAAPLAVMPEDDGSPTGGGGQGLGTSGNKRAGGGPDAAAGASGGAARLVSATQLTLTDGPAAARLLQGPGGAMAGAVPYDVQCGCTVEVRLAVRTPPQELHVAQQEHRAAACYGTNGVEAAAGSFLRDADAAVRRAMGWAVGGRTSCRLDLQGLRLTHGPFSAQLRVVEALEAEAREAQTEGPSDGRRGSMGAGTREGAVRAALVCEWPAAAEAQAGAWLAALRAVAAAAEGEGKGAW